LLGFGGRVVGLEEERCVSLEWLLFPNSVMRRLWTCSFLALDSGHACKWHNMSAMREEWGLRIANTYTALEVADKQALEDLAGLVAVADVFEGFG
jgi:hypothetical protein